MRAPCVALIFIQANVGVARRSTIVHVGNLMLQTVQHRSGARGDVGARSGARWPALPASRRGCNPLKLRIADLTISAPLPTAPGSYH
jgi:hypothetical protein